MNTVVKKSHKPKSRLRRFFKRILITIVIIGLLIFLLFKFSPWPSALIIRYAFDSEAEKVNAKLKRHVPMGIFEVLNQSYDPKDEDALLDVYFPSELQESGRELPVIVWIHGGGWISGNKGQIANYCKILASKGYVTVSIDYSIAPGANYPTPLRQINKALAFLKKNSRKFHLDKNHFVLAGDSGGAHIATQIACMASDSAYAKKIGINPLIARSDISGLLLYCGPYDVRKVNLEGDFGAFLKTVLWSYSGKKDFLNDEYFKTASVIDYITSDFPPCFISAGNGDPLLSHSQDLSRKLQKLNVKSDTLYFEPNLKPALGHEYQFNLEGKAGKQALDQSLNFLNSLKMNGESD